MTLTSSVSVQSSTWKHQPSIRTGRLGVEDGGGDVVVGLGCGRRRGDGLRAAVRGARVNCCDQCCRWCGQHEVTAVA